MKQRTPLDLRATTLSDAAETAFLKLCTQLAKSHGAEAGQMFGKRCIKVGGKAGVALFDDYIVFKLPEPHHAKAISLKDSQLWDPSGKGRAMKEWVQVQVPVAHKSQYKAFAGVAADYVG